MNAAQRLYEQYQQDLKRLQDTCPHERMTDWLDEMWAPAHGTGRQVRTCVVCDLVIQARRKCHGCENWFLEKDLTQGDRAVPMGAWYCDTCYQAKDKAVDGPCHS